MKKLKNDNKYSVTYKIEGIVQGVGFRPTVCRLARFAKLGGWIKNTSGSVDLCLIGEYAKIASFIETLDSSMPRHAKIANIEKIEEKLSFDSSPDFVIIQSSNSSVKKVVIPADIAMCEECEKEILDSQNRRYAYPFTTCTDCGPRYTVVNNMPYDRERTTLASFPLCEECMQEYTSFEDRRFHAESIACSKCGPRLFLSKSSGEKLDVVSPIFKTREFIAEGEILAIRGIGGFLIVADPFNKKTVCELRKRKNRPDKPFALMFRNLETLFKYCKKDANIIKLLKSPQSPIVISEAFFKSKLPIDLIAPDTKTLGVMIPYSPLHKLLFEQLKNDKIKPFDALIMTSGNRGGEPICISNDEAFENLADIADFILCHDREINLRSDDSIATTQLRTSQILRRARGYAPNPISININLTNNILAMGSDLKNSIALGYDNEVVFSPHIGDLETLKAIKSCKNISKTLPEFLKKEIQLVVTDLHPDFHSTRLGYEIAKKLDIPIVQVQHHHAHALACMAEHKLNDAIALVFDGTGLGIDGNIWGAELFQIESLDSEIKRLATFLPSHLPGGDIAVRQAKRQLIARFFDAGVEITNLLLKKYNISENEATIWIQQCKQNLNAPLSHSAGRLFDAFSTLIGVSPKVISYEGQVAIRLETFANSATSQLNNLVAFSTIENDNMLFIDWKEAFQKSYKNIGTNDLAMAFHISLANSAIKMIEFGLSKSKTRNIVLSGGCFMNKILNNLIFEKIQKLGLKLFIHQQIPPNDGGIALGQVLVAGI